MWILLNSSYVFTVIYRIMQQKSPVFNSDCSTCNTSVCLRLSGMIRCRGLISISACYFLSITSSVASYYYWRIKVEGGGVNGMRRRVTTRQRAAIKPQNTAFAVTPTAVVHIHQNSGQTADKLRLKSNCQNTIRSSDGH